jgi:hypothetical protein
MLNIIGNVIGNNTTLSSSENLGLLSSLLSQSGNQSTDIMLKTAYVGPPAGKGNWNSASAYGQGEIRAYPIGSPIMWRIKTATTVSAGEDPPISNPKWELAIGVDMIQNMGNGKWARTTLHHDEGEWIKMGPMEIGTYAPSRFTYDPSLPPNYVGNGSLIISTSTTSLTIPTTHPTSRTITIGTGLTIPNSVSVGTCNTSFAIPTTHATPLDVVLSTGQSISPGDSITLYGDANNFVVCTVGRYFSGTGVAHLGSVAHVGSGTFSSWTVKKEKLRRIYRTANSGGQYMLGLVQSYDSGTGSFTFNTIKNTGTGTFTDVTVALIREPVDPTSSASLQVNVLDAETLGIWYVVTGTGTSFLHRGSKDNRGCGWRYMYADGPMINNPPADIIVDTYNATSQTAQSTVAFDDLDPGTHTFVAVSCPSPSGLSANTRAWVAASTNSANLQTLRQAYNYDLFTADFAIMGQGQSNGELAFNFRENSDAGDTPRWFPHHGSYTERNNITTFVVDGVTLPDSSDFLTDANPYLRKYQPFTTCSLTQSGDIVHPEGAVPMGTYESTHTFSKSGVDFTLDINWTTVPFIATGYVAMLFLYKEFAKKIKYQDGAEYTTPQGANPDVNIDSADINKPSVLVYNDGTGVLGEPLYAFARYSGGTAIPVESAYINNYDANFVKLYPQTFSNDPLTAPLTQTINLKWYFGNRGSL